MATTWLGRVVPKGEARPRWVRLRTDGDAPGGADEVEEIEAPAGVDLYAEVTAGTAVAGGLRCPLGEVEVAVPVTPTKIICVGRNYRAHAQEFGNEVPDEPLLFFKPPSALVACGQPVVRPPGYERVDMEAELVVVVGRRAHNVDRSDALAYVAGYTLGNDVSNRDLQRLDKQWTRAKGFDTFAPLGPFVRMVAPGVPAPGDARIQGLIDDELRQDAALADMVFDPAAVLAYVSACMTLEPGDLLYTGTPSGVSDLKPGHVTAVALAGWPLGRLWNPIAGAL